MKKKLILIAICLFVVLTLPAGAQDKREATKTGTLTVMLDGFPNSNGVARVSLCNSEADCKSEKTAFRAAALPIEDKKALWILPDLAWGVYAVRVYHDENGNGKLDRNALSMPKEAYGFSNNARGTFGLPSYESMTFRLDRSQLTIRVTLK
jgi:uncharacterized protein (DUF2141 family)